MIGLVCAVVAKVVLSEQALTLLQRNGGRFSVGQRTGCRMLSRSDESFRMGTSNKILPAVEDLEIARDRFYWALQDAVEDNGIPPPELVINFDQTFQKYHPNRGFTWEKKDTSCVQLKSTKDGYTICFMT